MTDRENHTTSNGVKLTIADQNPDQVCVMMYDHRSGPSSHVGMILPTSRLLAMIDSIAPDAMRGYLRERSDYLDGPDELPIIERRLCDLIPEADSPEDIDERVRPTPAAAERLALLETVRALYAGLNSKVHREVVEWIIGDESVRIQDYNMAGEPIGPRTSQQLHESEDD